MLKSRSSNPPFFIAVVCGWDDEEDIIFFFFLNVRIPFPVINRCNIRNAALEGVIHSADAWSPPPLVDDNALIDLDEEDSELVLEETISLDVNARNALSHVPFGMASYGRCNLTNLVLLSLLNTDESSFNIKFLLMKNWSECNCNCNVSIPKLIHGKLLYGGVENASLVTNRNALSIDALTLNLCCGDGYGLVVQ